VIHKVYAPYIRARLGTASHFCEVVVLKLRTVPIGTALGILRVIRRGAHAMYKPTFPFPQVMIDETTMEAGRSSLELSDTQVYEP